jgi:hypothetical protein
VNAGELFIAAAYVQFYDWPHQDVVAAALRAGKTVYGHSPSGYARHAIVDEPDDEIFRKFPVSGGGYLISTPLETAPPADLVVTFRPPEEQPAIVRMAFDQGARSFWVQPPAESSQDAKQLAKESGIAFIERVDLRDVAR